MKLKVRLRNDTTLLKYVLPGEHENNPKQAIWYKAKSSNHLNPHTLHSKEKKEIDLKL